MTNNTHEQRSDDGLYEVGYLTREAERAGVSLVEYLIGDLRSARDSAANNADYWRAEKSRADTVAEEHQLMEAALRTLAAMDNCNYQRDEMRRQGAFDAARAILDQIDARKGSEATNGEV